MRSSYPSITTRVPQHQTNRPSLSSYGGIPASEAIIPALYSKNGTGPGVIHLIYLTCWLIPKSQSVQTVLGKYGFLSHVDVGMNDDGTAVAKNAPDAFYNDVLPRSRAEELAENNVTHNIMVVGGNVEGVPWMDVESTYVVCEKDEALLVHLQRSMVKDAQEAGGKVLVETLESGHCPFLSQPDEVVKIVESIVAKVGAGN